MSKVTILRGNDADVKSKNHAKNCTILIIIKFLKQEWGAETSFPKNTVKIPDRSDELLTWLYTANYNASSLPVMLKMRLSPTIKPCTETTNQY
jgi:hypothetical protein